MLKESQALNMLRLIESTALSIARMIPPLLGSLGLCLCHPLVAGEQAFHRRQIGARHLAEQRGDAGHDLAGGGAGIPAGGGEAVGLLQPLRLVEHDEDQVLRIVHPSGRRR